MAKAPPDSINPTGQKAWAEFLGEYGHPGQAEEYKRSAGLSRYPLESFSLIIVFIGVVMGTNIVFGDKVTFGLVLLVFLSILVFNEPKIGNFLKGVVK